MSRLFSRVELIHEPLWVTIPSQRRYVHYLQKSISFPDGLPSEVNVPEPTTKVLQQTRIYNTRSIETIYIVVPEMHEMHKGVFVAYGFTNKMVYLKLCVRTSVREKSFTSSEVPKETYEVSLDYLNIINLLTPSIIGCGCYLHYINENYERTTLATTSVEADVSPARTPSANYVTIHLRYPYLVSYQLPLEEVNSTDRNNFSPVRLSNYEDSGNDSNGEGDTHKKNQEKGNSVSDSTVIELRGHGEANSTHHGSVSSIRLSYSKNMIKALRNEPNTQK
uniref:Phosphatidylinositol 3,4,5-trisphosphate 3-phosphatase and protein-tyrosine-phosphatase PTEN1-like n=1 Tax=Tanacetum cinerariifolium TaxID=118510 RepID=A0A6L2LML8_TANCI|nr:phosphatidylinositol 3,4,5-trisphosphate 3-phosphatase and protein-tyrosine-phosphatase PTEN1-like [Tanacetum cinerariifolium]